MRLTTIAWAVVFAVLLVLDWHYRLRVARLLAAIVALVVLWFTQPSTASAARRAIALPPAERVRHPAGTEYASGVATMYEAVADDAKLFANERLLTFAVLFWLACSPLIHRADRKPTTDGLPSDEAAV